MDDTLRRMGQEPPARQSADLLGQLPATLTVHQAARLLRVTPGSAALAVVTGALPRRELAGRPVVPTRELLVQFGVPEGERA